ncbi:hypothetical protein HK096_010391 [Nowakowskiella sp. JEL0078]|nr:hypothetical protein HK096_010391 [Nowakowskiella sp. JEL0078]
MKLPLPNNGTFSPPFANITMPSLPDDLWKWLAIPWEWLAFKILLPLIVGALALPALLVVVIFLMGFTTAGVAAGSFAATWQAGIGLVTAGSVFAVMQFVGANLMLIFINPICLAIGAVVGLLVELLGFRATVVTFVMVVAVWVWTAMLCSAMYLAYAFVLMLVLMLVVYVPGALINNNGGYRPIGDDHQGITALGVIIRLIVSIVGLYYASAVLRVFWPEHVQQCVALIGHHNSTDVPPKFVLF